MVGEQFEGEEPPTATAEEMHAITVRNLLATGMGGIDWAGLPLVVEWLGVRDLQGLMQRLSILLSYRKPDERTAPQETQAPS